MSVCGYFACVYVYASFLCLVSTRPEEGIGFPEIGVTGGCELPHSGAGNQLNSSGRASDVPEC